MAVYWHKIRNVDEWNVVEDLDINLHLNFYKKDTNTHWKKKANMIRIAMNYFALLLRRQILADIDKDRSWNPQARTAGGSVQWHSHPGK